MYNVLIVEDEKDAADALVAALERFGQEAGEAFRPTWITSALELDGDHPSPDLIFMDIDLPGANGFDAAMDLRQHDHATPLIFVTNLAQYAVHGYAAEALDFIVKPFTYGDFAMRMGRALPVMRRRAQSVTVRTRDGVRILRHEELVCVEVSGHNLSYLLADGEELSARGSLTQAERDLKEEPFLRISSGCIINMGHVTGLAGDEVTLRGGHRVWITRANRRRCLAEIARFLGSST